MADWDKKEWLAEPISDDDWLADLKMIAGIAGPAVLLAACAAGFVLLLLK
jgi:hypothetical protein